MWGKTWNCLVWPVEMRKYLFHLPFIWSVFWKRKRGEVEVYNFQNIADIFGLRPLVLLQVHEVADDVKFEFIVDYCTQPRFRVKIASVNSGVYIRLRLGNFSCLTKRFIVRSERLWRNCKISWRATASEWIHCINRNLRNFQKLCSNMLLR